MRQSLLVSLLLLSPAAAGAQSTATLADCYSWASARSEDLKIRRETIKQSDARARAALGGALPYVAFEFKDTWQDPEGVDTLAAQGFAGFVEKEQVDSKFTFTQPLFSGLRDHSALKGFRRESARDALRLARAASLLYERTAASFYEVLRHEADRDNAAAAARLSEDRVKELVDFQKLGKSRESEVYTARAHAAALRANLRRIESRLFLAREDLSFLTGRDLSRTGLADALQVPAAPAPLEQAIEQAKERSDIRAQREDVAARRYAVRYQRGYYWPTADVSGNYYTERPAFMKEIEWDLALSIKVPLFQGGSALARTDEAKAGLRASELALEEMERRVAQNVRRTHGQLAAAIEETRSLEEAAAAAQKSYDALQEEYKLGLVTNLEVLQALDLLLAQRSARDAARLEAKRLLVGLDVAVKDIP